MHFLKLSTEEKTKNLELAKAVLQAETNKQLKDYRFRQRSTACEYINLYEKIKIWDICGKKVMKRSCEKQGSGHM